MSVLPHLPRGAYSCTERHECLPRGPSYICHKKYVAQNIKSQRPSDHSLHKSTYYRACGVITSCIPSHNIWNSCASVADWTLAKLINERRKSLRKSCQCFSTACLSFTPLLAQAATTEIRC